MHLSGRNSLDELFRHWNVYLLGLSLGFLHQVSSSLLGDLTPYLTMVLFLSAALQRSHIHFLLSILQHLLVRMQ